MMNEQENNEELNRAEEKLDRQQREITAARKTIEQEKQRFQDLFAFAPDGLLVTDTNGVIQQANPVAAQMLNVPEDELLGKTMASFVLQEARQDFRARVIRLAETGEEQYWDLQIQPKDKPAFQAAVKAANIKSFLGPTEAVKRDKGPLLYWSLRDITRRKQAELELYQRNAQLELLNEIAFAANESSMEAALQFALEAVCRYAGFTVGHVFTRRRGEGPLQGTQLWYLDDPERYRDFQASSQNKDFKPEGSLLAEVLASGEPLWVTGLEESAEFKRPLLEGKYALRTGVFYPILIGSEIASVMEFFTQDLIPQDDQMLGVLSQIGITLGRAIERERTVNRVKQSESLFRTVFSQSGIGMALLDLQGQIMEVNQSLEEMTGFNAAELRAKPLAEYLHPEDVGKSRRAFWEVIKGKRDHVQLEERYPGLNGDTRWGRRRLFLLRDENRQPQFVLAMVEDISREKALETELAEVKKRFLDGVEAERLFLAHEIHDGPVQDVLSVIFRLKRIESPQRVSEEADFSAIQEDLRRIVSDLRRIYGDLRPPTLAPFGLARAIRSHAETFEERHPQIQVGLSLQEDRQTLPEELRLALFRIYQHVLRNVVMHAEAENVLVSFTFDEDQIILIIHDDGKGFEVPKRLVDLARKGHHGLLGAAERARALGGDLEVNSVPNDGTLIKAVLPRNGQFPVRLEEEFSEA